MLLAALAVLAAFALPARAGTALDVFTIRGIDVDVTADNANDAKQQALADGQRQAFQQLLDRLVAPADRAKVPKVDGTDYVRSFSIGNERSTPVRYIATLAVRFDPRGVRKLLRDAHVAFTETRGQPVVVLPVYQAQGRTVLWDDPNPWRAAWSALGGGGLVPLVVPSGDVDDVKTVTVDQAVAGDTAHLTAEGARWQTGEVLVATAALSADGKHLAVSLAGLPGTPKPFASINYDLKPGETADAMMARAVADVSRAVDTVYKQDALQQSGDVQALSAIVPLSGLDGWLAVRGALARVPQVRSYEVVSLSRSEAALILHTVGGQDRVKQALAEAGLTMDWGGSYWTIRPAASPAAQR